MYIVIHITFILAKYYQYSTVHTHYMHATANSPLVFTKIRRLLARNLALASPDSDASPSGATLSTIYHLDLLICYCCCMQQLPLGAYVQFVGVAVVHMPPTACRHILHDTCLLNQ